jgi:hypothetical protein
MRVSALLIRWKTIGNGVKKIFPNGWGTTVFEYRQAEEVRDVFAANGVRYLFIGKSGAILLGYPDTTQDADVYVEKSVENGRAIVAALRELDFILTDEEQQQICRGKDFIQLKNGPFDLDLIYAPDGIEKFTDAWSRRVEVKGFLVCSIDDIIASKKAANRSKDRESLERLEGFREYLRSKR